MVNLDNTMPTDMMRYRIMFLGILLGMPWILGWIGTGLGVLVWTSPIVALIATAWDFANRERREMKKREYTSFALSVFWVPAATLFVGNLVFGKTNGEFIGWFIGLIGPATMLLTWFFAYFGMKYGPGIILKSRQPGGKSEMATNAMHGTTKVAARSVWASLLHVVNIFIHALATVLWKFLIQVVMGLLKRR